MCSHSQLQTEVVWTPLTIIETYPDNFAKHVGELARVDNYTQGSRRDKQGQSLEHLYSFIRPLLQPMALAL